MADSSNDVHYDGAYVESAPDYAAGSFQTYDDLYGQVGEIIFTADQGGGVLGSLQSSKPAEQWYDLGDKMKTAIDRLGDVNDQFSTEIKNLRDSITGAASDAFNTYANDILVESEGVYNTLKDKAFGATIGNVGHDIQLFSSEWWKAVQENGKNLKAHKDEIVDRGDSAIKNVSDISDNFYNSDVQNLINEIIKRTDEAVGAATEDHQKKLVKQLQDLLDNLGSKYTDRGNDLDAFQIVSGLSKKYDTRFGGTMPSNNDSGNNSNNDSNNNSNGDSNNSSGNGSGDNSNGDSSNSAGNGSGGSSGNGSGDGAGGGTGDGSGGGTGDSSGGGSGDNSGTGSGGSTGGGSGDNGAATQRAKDAAQKAINGLTGAGSGSGDSGGTGGGTGSGDPSGSGTGSGGPSSGSGAGGGQDSGSQGNDAKQQKAMQDAKNAADKAINGLTGGGGSDPSAGTGGGTGSGSDPGGTGGGTGSGSDPGGTGGGTGGGSGSQDPAANSKQQQALQDAKDAANKAIDGLTGGGSGSYTPDQKQALGDAGKAAGKAIDDLARKTNDPARKQALDDAKKAAQDAINGLSSGSGDGVGGGADSGSGNPQTSSDGPAGTDQTGGADQTGTNQTDPAKVQAYHDAKDTSDHALDDLAKQTTDPQRIQAIQDAKNAADQAIDQLGTDGQTGTSDLQGFLSPTSSDGSGQAGGAGSGIGGGGGGLNASQLDSSGGPTAGNNSGAAQSAQFDTDVSQQRGLSAPSTGNDAMLQNAAANQTATLGASAGANAMTQGVGSSGGMPMSGMGGMGGMSGMNKQNEREPQIWMQAEEGAWNKGDKAEGTPVLGRE